MSLRRGSCGHDVASTGKQLRAVRTSLGHWPTSISWNDPTSLVAAESILDTASGATGV
jgi:hypothetical protein